MLFILKKEKTMGQYHVVVNLDKEQYLNPREFGDGVKLLEFALSSGGVMTALALLLAESNNRGGGDLPTTHSLIGSWAGDRITVVGDYSNVTDGSWWEVYDFEYLRYDNPYELVVNSFTNISPHIISVANSA